MCQAIYILIACSMQEFLTMKLETPWKYKACILVMVLTASSCKGVGCSFCVLYSDVLQTH